MRQFKAIGFVGVLVLAGSLTVRADVWDVGTATDDVITQTNNLLLHGSSQVHDLAAKAGVADLDYFRIFAAPTSSYAVYVDGETADLDLTSSSVTLRNTSDVVLQTADFAIYDRRLAFTNVSLAQSELRVLVSGAACSTTCDANDQYQIRVYETTIAVPRFNNANGQVTVLLMQNTESFPRTASMMFFDNAGGQLFTSVPTPLNGYQTLVVNLSSAFSGVLQNTTGALKIAHNAGYGGLAVKTVALEPATGFSFDSPGLYKPR